MRRAQRPAARREQSRTELCRAGCQPRALRAHCAQLRCCPPRVPLAAPPCVSAVSKAGAAAGDRGTLVVCHCGAPPAPRLNVALVPHRPWVSPLTFAPGPGCPQQEEEDKPGHTSAAHVTTPPPPPWNSVPSSWDRDPKRHHLPPPNPSRRGWRCRWPRFQEHERGTRSRFSVILGTINQAGDRCGAAAAAAAGVSDGSRAAAWATCGSGVRAVPGSGVPAVPGSGCPQLWSPGCPCLWHPGCRWLRCPSCPQFHRPGCPRLRHPGSGAPPAVSGSIAPLSQLQCTLFSPAPVFIQPKCPSCPQLRHLRCPSPGCHQLRSPALSQLWLSQLQCPLCSQLQPCASPLPRSSGCLQPQPSHSPSSSIPFSPVSSVPAVPSPVALSPLPNPRILINKDKGPTQRLSLYVQVYIQKMAKKRETQKNIYKGEGAEVEGAGATPHLRSPLCTGPGRRYLHQGIFTGERGHRTGDAPGEDGTGAAVWLCPGP